VERHVNELKLIQSPGVSFADLAQPGQQTSAKITTKLCRTGLPFAIADTAAIGNMAAACADADCAKRRVNVLKP
jgi:hypothetical protein